MLQGARVQYLTFLLSSVAATPTDIWHVSIDEGPAPAPEDGPPAAANAIRDKAYLPAQIASIIGAYALFVVFIGAALLLVGRRLRRAAQASPRTLAMEMVKPVRTDVPQVFDPSPVSPTSQLPYGKSPSSTVDTRDMWPSPQKSDLGYSFQRTGGHNKQTSMQSSVVTFDESVIEDDKARNQQEMERLYAAVMEHDELKSTSTLNKNTQQQLNPPELQHLRNSSATQQQSFPPRNDTKSPGLSITTSPRKHTRPSPITTTSRASSRSSFGSFGKKRGVRNLPISPPIGSPELVPEYSSTYGEAEPLSPRYYEPGPPPPTPPQREVYQRHEERMDAERMSPRHTEFPRTSLPRIETSSPRESQQSNGTNSSQKPKRAPPPLALRTQGNSLAPGSHSSLRTAPLPLRNLNSDRTTRPPSMIKATVLESKPHNRHLEGPRTGVPTTPYSPYMPFTPLTPMTPSRLVTREERKRKEKEEGRRVVTIDDKVEEESEMWGDAYP